MMAGPQGPHSPPLSLDSHGCVTLEQILRSFTAPITEEHAWAIIHQAVICLGELEGHGDLYLMESPGELLISQEGTVHPFTFTRPGVGRQEMTNRVSGVIELGSVVYSALDYSLPEDEERTLSAGLDNVINMMVEIDPGEDVIDDDEGIGEETGVYYSDKSDAAICRVLELCRHHLAVPGEAVPHYRAVCRALVTEARELTQFMSGISDLDGDLQGLDRGDWADVWTQVMSQLRRGIRLKKVDYSRTPAEYEMTPYEMLMDDVRTKKYSLSPAPPRNPKVETDARDLILEFIRSRPPLRPVTERKLKEKEEEVNVHESLLSDIRGTRARQSLRKTPARRPRESSLSIDTTDNRKSNTFEELSPDPVTKKVIDLDESFVDKILNFEESPNNSSEEIVMSPRQSPDREEEEEKRREEEETRREVEKRLGRARERGATSMSRINGSISSTSSSSISSRRSTVSSHVEEPSPPPKTKYTDWISKLHTLDLNLEEVSHMRYTMTKVELEELELSPKDRAAYEKSKICFGCHKVWFNMFNWSYHCEFCKRYVCVKCCTKIRLPSDKLREIPVCCLSNQLESPNEVASPSIQATSTTNLASSFTRGWDRNSLRGQSGRSREMTSPLGGGGLPSKPRLQRAKSMDKADTDKFKAMQLSGERAMGSRHNVCLDCRDLLTSIVRAQRHAAKLKMMKRRLGGGLQSMGEMEEI